MELTAFGDCLDIVSDRCIWGKVPHAKCIDNLTLIVADRYSFKRAGKYGASVHDSLAEHYARWKSI